MQVKVRPKGELRSEKQTSFLECDENFDLAIGRKHPTHWGLLGFPSLPFFALLLLLQFFALFLFFGSLSLEGFLLINYSSRNWLSQRGAGFIFLDFLDYIERFQWR